RDLHGEAGPVPIDRQPGEPVAFAEHEPARLARGVELPAIRDRLGDPTPQQRAVQILVPAPRHDPHGDGGGGIVVAPPQEAPAVIDHIHGRAPIQTFVDPNELPTLDPTVTRPRPPDAALPPGHPARPRPAPR